MSWTCPSCENEDNCDSSVRCSCGYEIQDTTEQNYNKIGGALIIIALGLILTPISYLIPFRKRLEGIETFTPELYIAEGLQAFIFVLIPLLFLYMLFRKKRNFPKLLIGYYSSGFFWALGNYFIAKSAAQDPDYYIVLNDSIDRAVILFVVSAIWISYLLFSQRVKETFKN